jgi:hypothetical protein
MINKNTQLWYRSVLCAVVLAGTACNQQDEAASAEPNSQPGSAAESMGPEISKGESIAADGPGKQISAAVADLSSQTGVAADEISVTEARAVSWRSGALGCPEKGRSYTQSIVPGMLLLLQADGRTYRFHSSATGKPFHCPDARAEAPALGVGDALM